MIKYSTSVFENLNEAKNFVKECEDDFERRLTDITKAISREPDLRIMTLTGPTCSGKTTAAKKLVDSFAECSKRVNIISIDDFYYDRERIAEISREKGMASVDYESANAIDLAAFDFFIDEIFDNGKREVHCPIYDFTRGARNGFRTLECTEDDIFVFEGIQAIYPQVTSLLGNHKSVGMLICALSSIDVGGNVFEPNEIRLLRRLVRDNHYRATPPSATFEMWKNVRHNEDVNIFPFLSSCKYTIDSVFPCEISLLKPYLDEILLTVDKKSEFYDKAQEILKKISGIEPLPKEFISENSLYHEFI